MTWRGPGEPTGPNEPAAPLAWWALTAAAAWLLVGAWLFQEGSFFDGLTYSSIARNTALAGDPFWRPRLDWHAREVFLDHPPLGTWLESLLFRLLGDRPWVDRLFAGLCAAATLAVVAATWRRLARGPARGLAWLPLVLLLVPPVIHRTYRAPMLENTMQVFATAAVLAFLAAKARTGAAGAALLVLSGGLTFAAALVKGPVALFPLGVPLAWAVAGCGPRRELPRDLLLVAAGFAVPLAALLLLVPEARAFLGAYVDAQVVRSLAGGREYTGRGRMALRLASELAAFAGAALVLGWGRLTLLRTSLREPAARRTIVFTVLVALGASLPLFVSPKLFAHYLLPSFVFYALAVALALAPAVADRAARVPGRLVRGAAAAAVAAALALTVGVAGTPRAPDREQLEVVRFLDGRVAGETRVALLEADWRLIAYLQRYHRLAPAIGPGPRERWLVTGAGRQVPGFRVAFSTARYAVQERDPR